jgi:hypothetical protein
MSVLASNKQVAKMPIFVQVNSKNLKSINYYFTVSVDCY